MAPRREDEDDGAVLIAEGGDALSRSPTSFASNRFIKSLSTLSIEHTEDSPTTTPVNREAETARASLMASIRLVAERGERLTARVSNMLTGCEEEDGYSLIIKACLSSLQTEFLYMMDEVQLLLDNMNMGDDGTDSSMTSWRVSLAQIRVDAYLEAIETALACCRRDSDFPVDVEQFATVCHNIASQLLQEDGVAIRISPWNVSLLGFDVTVATPVHHVLEAKHGGLPLQLQVVAIQEVQAKDMFDGKVPSSFRACKVYVERCVHDFGRSFRSGAGGVGDALVVVRVSPIEEEKGDASVENLQKWQTEVSRPVVREARNVQVNAFPPSPKSMVDLYVSTNHGDSDTTLTLRFPTYETLNNAIADVRLELVLG